MHTSSIAPVRLRNCLFLILIASAGSAFPQSNPESPAYGRSNTFGLTAEYSNDSSHILLGRAEQRKLLIFGVDYRRRLWRNTLVNWQYLAEVRPIMLESDPVTKATVTYTSPLPVTTLTSEYRPASACHSGTASYSHVYNGITYSSNVVDTCSRTVTFGQGISPLGSQWNFRPSHRIQPVFSLLGGYMFSTKPIPIETAGSFNFLFEVGAGVEVYRDGNRSLRAEYCVHHISNAYTGSENPGIDNGLLKIVYSFGR